MKHFSLADLDTHKYQIFKEFKNAEYIDPEDMGFTRGFTYPEITEIIDTNYFAEASTGYALPPGFYDISDPNLMLKSLLSKEVQI